MVELFRFIQQAFVIPGSAKTINLRTQSPFQLKLDQLMSGQYELVRAEAEKYLNDIRGLDRSTKYGVLDTKLRALTTSAAATGPATTTPTLPEKVNNAVKEVFGQTAAELVASQQFKDELIVAADVLVAVKLITRFDRVDSPGVTTMRQVIAFVADFVAGSANPLTVTKIQALLDRPVRVPQEFFPRPGGDPQLSSESSSATTSVADADAERRAGLEAEQVAFRQAYDLLMSARSYQLAVHTADREQTTSAAQEGLGDNRGEAATSVLGVAPGTIAAMDPLVREHLRSELPDLATASVQDILAVVKGRWLAASGEIEPSLIPEPARIYRVGANLFAVQKSPATDPEPEPVPDFSHAITRPVGFGDLQVVRQELIGYVPSDISHIENVLPGELLKKTTKREETSELIISDITESAQSSERDTQTAERNELASEASKEAGQDTFSTQDQTSTSSYGKLVENSKTNYARNVTDRAVNKLSQSVKQERTQRERKVYTEESVHQLDNSDGLRPVRGIYQWVDKKYKTQVFNCGKRLLYDVVLPEPAAFLIKSLEDAVQPVDFQIKKPEPPTVKPGQLHAGNYQEWATAYGVTGAVAPPPSEFTIAIHTDTATAGKKADGHYDKTFFEQYFKVFTLPVPEGYEAVGGYIQRTNESYFPPPPETPATDTRTFEFMLGEKTLVRFIRDDVLNKWFTFDPGYDKSGSIPVTARSFASTLQFNFAIGLVCRRTERALEKWQLETHAKIVAGYQRLQTEYLDQLGRYKAALRTQLTLASALGHDTATARQELKKAFIHLLMSEHFGQVYYPAPVPTQFPPDPVYIKQWGAVAAFFERAFEWEHLMHIFYPYFWGRKSEWEKLILVQDNDPQFEAFLKAGAARVVIPVRPGFEAALAHYHETGDVWMGEEIPDMFSDRYVSIIAEIKARNAAEGEEVLVDEWEVRLPTTLVMLREDDELPEFASTADN